jgi:hypothetical protein
MKRHLAAFPLTLGLLIALAFSLLPGSPALGDNIPACQGSGNPSTKLTLGGRTITPTLILQAANGQPCPAGETTLNLVSLSHTIIVSPNGIPTQNGTTLLQAMTLISNSNPSTSNPYLLKLEPGNYDLGNQSLTLLPYVDLEGSGEGTTTISSTIASPSYPPTNGTLVAASNSEVRFVKVLNAGASVYHIAVFIPNGATNVRFSHLTAATPGSGNATSFAIFNSGGNILVSNSTVSASGGTNPYGLFNYNTGSGGPGSVSTIIASNLSASNGSNQNSALYNSAGNSILSDSILTASGGAYSYVAVNNSGSTTVSSSTLTASGGSSFNIGFSNTGGSSTVSNSTLSASGPFSYGFYRTGGTGQVIGSQLSGANATSAGLTACPFSVNGATFAPLTNGGPC